MGQPRTEFKARRRLAGFTQESLAEVLRISGGAVKDWEQGRTSPLPTIREDLASALKVSLPLLDSYFGDGDGNGDSLPALSVGWWSNFEAFEQSAIVINTWEPVLVPGLLQTPAYATALLHNDELVSRRMQRQHLVTRDDNPVVLSAVIDESVLLRPIGGREVFVEQLQHMLNAAARGNVTIRILPLTATEQPAYWGTVVILSFPWMGGLVYLEHTGGSHSLDSLADVENHQATFDHLVALSLSEADSLALIASRVTELGEPHDS